MGRNWREICKVVDGKDRIRLSAARTNTPEYEDLREQYPDCFQNGEEPPVRFSQLDEEARENMHHRNLPELALEEAMYQLGIPFVRYALTDVERRNSWQFVEGVLPAVYRQQSDLERGRTLFIDGLLLVVAYKDGLRVALAPADRLVPDC